MTTPQVILVTGSNGGFGRLIVQTLARQGHIVFAGMRQPTAKNTAAAAELRALADAEKIDIQVVALDITDDDSVNQAIEQVVTAAGRIDVVVNNAGVSFFGPLESFTIAQVQQEFDTNFYGVMRMNNAAIPHMRTQGSGLLIQIGSVAGRIAMPFLGLYGATKFALEGLTESYRYELAAFGIDSLIIEPGTFPTTISANRQLAEHQDIAALYNGVTSAFMPQFFAENRSSTPPDPQLVADAIAKLVAQPAGERPLRTVVAVPSQSAAPQAVNDASERASREYLDMLGVYQILTLDKKQPS